MNFRALAVLLAMTVLSLTASGCAATNAPASGMLFTSVSGPIGATDHGAQPQAAAAPAAPAGLKSGTSETTGFLWLVSIGDASIDTAKKNGSISRVATVDYHHMIVLGGLFSQFRTTVKGE